MTRGWAVLLATGTILAPAAAPTPPSWEVELAPPGEPGAPFVLEGRVIGAQGRPLRGVLVHVYHADDRGIYSPREESDPRLAGMLRTNVLGGFRVRSVLPGPAEGVPHLHLELAGPGADYRTVTLSLCRAEGAGSDTMFARLPQMLTLSEAGSWSWSWAYVRRDSLGVFRCA